MAGRTQGNYVRVLYDYKYDSNGKHIVIKEGDKCLLLKKTNSEWWSVIKQGEKKPIYVPANYVVELSEGKKGGKGGLRRHGGSVEDIADDEKSRSSSEDLLQTDDAFHNGSCDTSEHDSDSVRNKLTASEDSLDKIVDVDGGEGDGGTHDGGGGGGSRVQNMVDKYEAPEYANLETIRQAAKKAKQDAEPEYANIAHIQAALRSAAPRPSMSCIPVRQYRCAAGKDWDMYTDAETGRSYYHNVATGESTWKPPRGLRTKDSGSPIPSPVPPPTPSPKPPAPAVPEKPPPSPGRGRLKSFNSFGTAVVLGTGSDGEEPSESTTETKAKAHSLPRLSQVPKGWSEEKTEDGVTTYYNQVTSEKYPGLCREDGDEFGQSYLSSVDDSGRVYFYKKDQSESTWVLPQASAIRFPNLDAELCQRLNAKLSKGTVQIDITITDYKIEQLPSKSTSHHQRHGSIDSTIPGGPTTSFKPRHSAYIPDGLAAVVGHYPPNYRHSIAASPSAVHEEDKRDDLRSPKLKPVDLPSVPDLVLLTTSEAASGPASPAESPLSPSFQANSTPTESPSGSLKRHAQGERRDTLNRTKVTENGKKVKKNWCPSYVVVQGSTLYFYKDHKAATPKASSRSGRPDEVIDLHGATIETNMKEKTSRKNSIVITLLSGTQWLLQADDAQKIQNWYGTLAHNLAQMPQLIVSRGSQDSLDVSSDSLEQLDDDGSPQTAAQMKRKKSRKVSKEADKGGACTLTDREKTSTLEDLPFPEKSSKIKDRLKNFFGQRPEKKTLQAKGIIKETVFGANLQHLAEREKTPVPKYLVQAITEIEEKGLAVDGIYRVSGNLSQIMKLRHMVDQNEKYNFDNPDWDIHVLTGALKLFFRELMEPLFPFKQFSMLLNAIKLQSRSDKVRAFKDAIKTLPRANRETIKYLFRHLNKVIEHSRENRMQTQNVAIVFGPTLMWPEEETQNVTVTTVYQSQIVEFILLEYKHIF